MFSRLMSITNHLYWLITTYTGPPKMLLILTFDIGFIKKCYLISCLFEYSLWEKITKLEIGNWKWEIGN